MTMRKALYQRDYVDKFDVKGRKTIVNTRNNKAEQRKPNMALKRTVALRDVEA